MFQNSYGPNIDQLSAKELIQSVNVVKPMSKTSSIRLTDDLKASESCSSRLIIFLSCGM